MKLLYKLERKYGKYAIKNLPLVVVLCFGIGYLIYGFAPGLTAWLDFSPPQIIYEHQYWRLFTWIFSPAGGISFLSLLMLFFYYSFARAIEQGIGTFLFNLYIFGGCIFSTLCSLGVSIYYYFKVGNKMVYYALYDHAGLGFVAGMSGGAPMMSIMEYGLFLGFALVFADAVMMLYFVLPFKASWLAYIDMIFLAYEFVTAARNGAIVTCATIIGFLINFFVFYLLLRKSSSSRRTQSINRRKSTNAKVYGARKDTARKMSSSKKTDDSLPAGITRHKCAICGRTENDGDLEFRFCSKCKGNYEYCNDHLFTHEHVK